jgi:hypothetical protein
VEGNGAWLFKTRKIVVLWRKSAWTSTMSASPLMYYYMS